MEIYAASILSAQVVEARTERKRAAGGGRPGRVLVRPFPGRPEDQPALEEGEYLVQEVYDGGQRAAHVQEVRDGAEQRAEQAAGRVCVYVEDDFVQVNFEAEQV